MNSIRELGLNYKKTKSEKDFNNLFHRIKPNLLSYINGIVKDIDAANDVFSITMTNVYNKIEQYNTRWNISTWIYSMAKNDALIYLKHKDVRSTSTFSNIEKNNKSVESLNNDYLVVENDYIVQSEEDEYSEQINNDYQRVLDCIDDFDPKYKNILYDRLVLELKYEDISNKYDIPLQTVKNRVRRGKIKIKQRFGIYE